MNRKNDAQVDEQHNLSKKKRLQFLLNSCTIRCKCEILKNCKDECLQGISTLHGSYSWLSPSQGSPSHIGRGLVHVLVLVFIPPSHDSVHDDHSVQADQFPFTVSKHNIIY